MPDQRPPYRLCFVNSMRTWGGAEVWMLETALALRERGHAVEFVANTNSELAARAVDAGLAVKRQSIKVDGAPWTIAALLQHFRRRRITALIANRTKDVKVAAPAARLAGVPVILATRESDFPLKDRLDYRWNFQNLCTGVLVNSRATRQTILDSAPWLDPARVHLLYKGIDVARFCPGPAPTGRPVVGVVGQLVVRKGILELMQAWSMIDAQDREPRPILRLAGEGDLRERLQKWRRKLRHPDDVQLLGYTENVEQFYQELSVLAMPSHFEGFGLAAAEALACGVPVVAGNASSLPEIVVDGETGLLIKPGNSEHLTRALCRLLDNPTWARQLGAAGRELVLARYPREQKLDQLLGLTGHPDYDQDFGQEGNQK